MSAHHARGGDTACHECGGDGYTITLDLPIIHTHDAILPTEYRITCRECRGTGYVRTTGRNGGNA